MSRLLFGRMRRILSLSEIAGDSVCDQVRQSGRINFISPTNPGYKRGSGHHSISSNAVRSRKVIRNRSQAVLLEPMDGIQAISLGDKWAYRPGHRVKSRNSNHAFGHAGASMRFLRTSVWSRLAFPTCKRVLHRVPWSHECSFELNNIREGSSAALWMRLKAQCEEVVRIGSRRRVLLAVEELEIYSGVRA